MKALCDGIKDGTDTPLTFNNKLVKSLGPYPTFGDYVKSKTDEY